MLLSQAPPARSSVPFATEDTMVEDLSSMASVEAELLNLNLEKERVSELAAQPRVLPVRYNYPSRSSSCPCVHPAYVGVVAFGEGWSSQNPSSTGAEVQLAAVRQ
jgi:hypothetical protein